MLAAFAGLALASCVEEEYTIQTGETITSITTGVAEPTANFAVVYGTVKGNISELSATAYSVGAYYGTAEDPTTSGSKQTGSIDVASGLVSTTLTNLTLGETYYYAAYITLQGTVTYFGEVKSFVASDVKVTTADASSVSSCKATLTGSVNGADAVDGLSSGVKYALSEDEVASGVEVECGAEVVGLLPGYTYYYAAYAQLGEDGATVWGATKSFTTAAQEMEYVDLGLSVLWAACNLGAEAASEVGALAGYGDVTAMQTTTSLSAYASCDLTDTAYDIAAAVDIDGDSPMTSALPTADQIAELLAGTTQSWDTVDGVEGIRFTAANGNSIFLPAAGYRSGDELVENGAGYYWSGTISPTSSDYAKTLSFSSGSDAKCGSATRYLGLALRSIRPYSIITLDEEAQEKILYGNIEGAGTFRIELYNEYGDTKTNSAIDPSTIVFSKNMCVTFTLSGLDGNMAEGTYIGGLEFSSADWSYGYWSGLSEITPYEIPVTGDGTYTVWCETTYDSVGTVVFCIDIKGLASAIYDMDQVSVTIDEIALDADVEVPVNTDIVQFFSNGNDGRIEVYSEYANGGALAKYWYDDILAFSGMMVIDFTISGIDGNLTSGAASEHTACISYADASWDPSYWGGNSWGNATVTGDGSYQVWTWLNGDCEGAIFWAIELYNLWSDLADTSKVSVSIDRIAVPHKL